MSQLCIVLLEDDVRRAAAMQRCLEDRFPQYLTVIFSRAQELCGWLDQHFEDVLLMSLDHDLALETLPDGRMLDGGVGLEVAEYLARRSPRFPVILHSTNSDGAARMEAALNESGWSTRRVIPYDDLAWVAQSWRQVVRDALVALATPNPAAAPVPPRTAALLTRLRTTLPGGPQALTPPDQDRLLRWLTRVLRRSQVLVGYVRWLQERATPFPDLELLPWERVRRVLRHGLHELAPEALVRLAFNPVALYDLHDRIQERRPAAWRRRETKPDVLPIKARPGRSHKSRPSQPRLVKSVASPYGNSFQVFISDLLLTGADGPRLEGALEWNCKSEGSNRECYLRVRIPAQEGLTTQFPSRRHPPSAILRTAPEREPKSGFREWREEVPLCWDDQGNLVSAWLSAPVSTEDELDVVLTLWRPGATQEAALPHVDRRCSHVISPGCEHAPTKRPRLAAAAPPRRDGLSRDWGGITGPIPVRD